MPGSGSVWAFKGDVRTDKLLIEAKFTSAGYYNLTSTTWNKIVEEAAKDGLRMPCMFIDIQELELVVFDEVMLPAHLSPTRTITNGKRIGLNKELPYPLLFSLGKHKLTALKKEDAEEVFDAL